MTYSVVKYIHLTPEHKSTKNTIHRLGNSVMGIPYKLEIVKYEDTPGFYLLYFDQSGEELTDTYHDDLKSALDQAEWEFNIKKEDWQ